MVSASMQEVSRAETLWLKIIGFLLILLGLTLFVSPRITAVVSADTAKARRYGHDQRS